MNRNQACLSDIVASSENELASAVEEWAKLAGWIPRGIRDGRTVYELTNFSPVRWLPRVEVSIFPLNGQTGAEFTASAIRLRGRIPELAPVAEHFANGASYILAEGGATVGGRYRPAKPKELAILRIMGNKIMPAYWFLLVMLIPVSVIVGYVTWNVFAGCAASLWMLWSCRAANLTRKWTVGMIDKQEMLVVALGLFTAAIFTLNTATR